MEHRFNRFYLVVIADYNDDDAHGVVQDNLYYWFDNADLTILAKDRVDVSPFNTVETGYMLARRALNPLSPSQRQVFFVNTAPRMDDKAARKTNEGEGFVRAVLKNGKQIFAVNSGHTLSFVKPDIAELNLINVPASADDIPVLKEALATANPDAARSTFGAGQFRSGYIYPIATAQALAGNNTPLSPQFETLLGPEIDPATVPDIPDDTVVFRDGYGNLKTSIRPEAMTEHVGAYVVVALGTHEIIARIRQVIFDVPNGHFSLAPGSTILAYGDGTQRQFVELVLRGGHAAEAFRTELGGGHTVRPRAGDGVTWRVATSDDHARLGYGDDGALPTALLTTASRV